MDYESKIKSLRREIRNMQLVLERKNKELDALHFVWCNGGCKGGTHRYTEQNLTEEIVQLAEQNTNRLREWFNNMEYRKKHGNL
jgi:hypothetical protein